jgi:integrase
MADTKKVVKLKPQSEFKKLTQRTASAYKPRGNQLYVRDTELKGYFLRILPTGYKGYGVVGKLGTSRNNKQISIGSVDLFTEKQARAKATEYLQLLKQGIDPRQQVREQTEESLTNPTLQEVHTAYCEGRQLKQTTMRDYNNVWKQPWVAELGRRPIKELTHTDIVTWYNKNKHKHPRQTEKTYTMIGTAFKYALPMGYITENIVESKTKSLLERVSYEPKETYLEQETELPAFLSSLVELSIEKKLNETHRDWILFSMLYGMRTKGASLLQWDWIDMEKKIFTIPPIEGTKLKQKLELPLTNLVLTMLTSRWYKEDKHKKFVFPSRDNTRPSVDARRTIDKVINRTKQKLKNPEFHTSWHDWRSTWTNVAIASGIPLDERERIQGHSNKKRASAIYSREVYDVQRDYLERHHQVLTQGMEYRGELYMMYADDEGIDRDLIVERFTTVGDPISFEPVPQEEHIEVDMFKRFTKDFKGSK